MKLVGYDQEAHQKVVFAIPPVKWPAVALLGDINLFDDRPERARYQLSDVQAVTIATVMAVPYEEALIYMVEPT